PRFAQGPQLSIVRFPAEHTARILVDGAARSERYEVDHVPLSDPVDAPKSADAKAPIAFEVIAKLLPGQWLRKNNVQARSSRDGARAGARPARNTKSIGMRHPS